MNVAKITIFCYNKSYLKVGVGNANILLLKCLPLFKFIEYSCYYSIYLYEL